MKKIWWSISAEIFVRYKQVSIFFIANDNNECEWLGC